MASYISINSPVHPGTEDENVPSPSSPLTIRAPNTSRRFEPDSSDDESSNPGTPDPLKNTMMTMRDALKKSGVQLDERDEIMLLEEEVDEEMVETDDNVIHVIQIEQREAQQMGLMDKLKSVPDILVTKPIIRIQNNPNEVIRKLNRNRTIIVPPTKVEETLHERFNEIQNKVKKRHLTPYFSTLSYLHHSKDMAMKKIYSLGKVAMEMRARAVRGSDTMAANIAKDLAAQQDLKKFWQEQLDYWAENYLWINKDGVRMTREELDRELEAYMAKRGFIPMTDVDMLDKELDEYFAKMGIRCEVLPDKEELDDDLDNYKRRATETQPKQVSNNNSVEAELDADLEAYLQQRATSSASTLATRATVGTSRATGRLSSAAAVLDDFMYGPNSTELDEELDNYWREQAKNNFNIE